MLRPPRLLLLFALFPLCWAIAGFQLDSRSGALTPLPDSLALNTGRVQEYLFELEESPDQKHLRRQAENYLHLGLSLAAKPGERIAAVEKFRLSARHFPMGRTYFDLGLLYTELKRYPEALQALEIADLIDEASARPGEVAYALARVYALDDALSDRSHYLYYNLERSILEGFLTVKMLKADSAFAKRLNSGRYQDNLAHLFSPAELKAASSDPQSHFSGFLAYFPTLHSNQLCSDSIDSPYIHSDHEFRNVLFAEFIPEVELSSFSRMGSNQYIPLGKFAADGNFVATVYRNVTNHGSGHYGSYTNLAIFSTGGKLMDRLVVGCNCSPETVKQFRYANGVFVVTEHQNIYRHPYYEADPDENPVIGKRLVETRNYRIGPDGRFHLETNAQATVQP